MRGHAAAARFPVASPDSERGSERRAMNNGGIAWFARNPVAANLMMVFIILSGLIATTAVKEEVMPETYLLKIDKDNRTPL